jgi:hypothetical protein
MSVEVDKGLLMRHCNHEAEGKELQRKAKRVCRGRTQQCTEHRDWFGWQHCK